MNLLIGVGCLLLCTVVQGLVVAGLLIALRSRIFPDTPSFLASAVILCASVLALFSGIAVQVAIWALVYLATGEIETLSRALYFSLVNFTTLGYGDIVLSEERAILGPLEAANGVLMLGLSTGFLISVVERLNSRMPRA